MTGLTTAQADVRTIWGILPDLVLVANSKAFAGAMKWVVWTVYCTAAG